MDFFGVDMIEAIKAIGYIGLFGIVFAETGLFLGFFFPGDSLLFVAGVLAAQGFFSLPILLVGLFIAAFMGNLLGYWFGGYVGPRLFSREDSLLFRKSHLIKAQKFYEKYGPKMIVLARFVPIVRTFAPIVAGVAKMHYGTFVVYNFIGALLWSVGLTTLAYYLGGLVENVDRYLLPIVLLIIFLSVLPGIVEYWRDRREAKRTRMENR